MNREHDLFGRLIVLIGGDGFFGTPLTQQLLGCGARVRVASRHPERGFRLRPLAALGQIQFTRCDLGNPAAVAATVAGAEAVINLAGAFRGNLDALHVAGARRLAEASRAAGVGAFVQISALGADTAAASRYWRSKAEGEAAVLAALPGATIVRPSVLFGQDDRFVNLFGGLIARLPVIPVFAPTAELQPLHVEDAAEAVVTILGETFAGKLTHRGRTYEIAGPEAISMIALNRRIAAAQGRNRLFLELPDFVSAAIAKATGSLPFAPLSSDQWAMLKAGNVLSGRLPGLKALGVTPRPLGLFLDRWMTRYRRHGRFGVRTAGFAARNVIALSRR